MILAKAGKCFLFILFIQAAEGNYTLEKNLYSTLLSDYKTSIRPSVHVGRPVMVQFRIQVAQLREYDLKRQTMTVTAFVMMHWNDPQLKWNMSEYGGVERMNFLNSEIWTPDIVLYNSAYEERETWQDTYPSKTIVFSDGQVIWNMPVIWYVSCQSDITWFPVDRQECALQFGSWSYSYSQLRLVPWMQNNTGRQDILPNGQWRITKVSSDFVNASFTCCPEPFSMMNHIILFEHLSSYYFIYIILPMGALCFMFLLTFFIPVDSGERLGFGVTVILSVTVYLLVISDKLPEKSDVKPMLGIIFVGEFFILCFGLMIAAISIIIHSNQKRGSKFLRRIARVDSHQRKSVEKYEMAMAKGYRNSVDEDEKVNNSSHPSYKSSVSVTSTRRIKEEWEILSKFLDRIGFIFTSLLMIIYPIIVCLSLSTDNLQ